MKKPHLLLLLASLFGLATNAHAQNHLTLRRTSFSVTADQISTTNLRFGLTCGEPITGPVASTRLVLDAGFWGGNGRRPCDGDVDDGSGIGNTDGGVTIDDLLYFLDQFSSGSLRADLDDGSGIGNPDGGVTIDDLLYYLQRFESGC